MLHGHRSFTVMVIVAVSLTSVTVQGGTQEAPARWILAAGGGYATQLDAGSSGLGSFSLGASAVRPRGRKLALGIEVGYDRHEKFGSEGDIWWNGGSGGIDVTGECPEPCTWRHVTLVQEYVGAAWHLGGVLRYTFAPARAVVPSAELGAGLYAVRNGYVRRARDATTGAPIPELSGQGTSTDLAPGVSGALGVDVFPGNGRIGVGAVARLRMAGRPANDYFLGVGFASLQARVTLR
jgi:hypothetical protein